MLEIAFYFAILSIVSVGGMPSVMPEMQRIVVDVQGWMTAAEFTQIFAIAQAAPGPNVLVTALVGWKVAGIAGGLLALGAFCLPAGALSYTIGRLWDRFRDAPWRKAFQRALVPVTIGFVLSGGYLLGTPHGLEWRGVLIMAASAAILFATKMNPLWILAGGGVLGAILF